MRIPVLTNVFDYFSTRKEHNLKTLYAALIILSLHSSLVLFVNSSYLAQFFQSGFISFLYVFASCVSLLTFFYSSTFLRTVGNFKLAVILTLLEMVALFGMAFAGTPIAAGFFFTLHFVVVPLIFLSLDVFMEAIIGTQEIRTGGARGLYLVFLSLAGAIAPALSGLIIEEGDITSFTSVYVASALLLLPFLAVITFYFNKFQDGLYPKSDLKQLLSTYAREKDTRNVFIAQLHLQFFFTWMVIYTPLYLASVAGFNWVEIGYILFASQLAYVICEYPIGVIADRYLGEKEMMAFGFFLLAISTSWLSFLPSGNIAIWMLVMFLTRVGASFVEVTSESYFFKHTRSTDSDKISLFRSSRSIASIYGALLGSFILIQVEFNFIFIVLGVLMIPGIFFTLLLKDTK